MLTVQTILHPTDFSERSQYALWLACALAQDYSARLIVLHVTEVPTVGRPQPASWHLVLPTKAVFSSRSTYLAVVTVASAVSLLIAPCVSVTVSVAVYVPAAP